MRPSSDSQQLHFDSYARSYEAASGLTTPVAGRNIDRTARRHAAYLAAAPPGPVLELGAGTGFLTRHLAPLLAARPYLATDISDGMLSVARSAGRHLENVEWRHEDALALDVPDSWAACVVGHGVLHHLPLAESLTEISRVLAPHGRLAFCEPHLLNPLVFAQKKIPPCRPSLDTPGETALRAGQMRALLRAHGFTDATIIHVGFVPSGVRDPFALLVERAGYAAERLPLVRYLGASLLIYASRQ